MRHIILGTAGHIDHGKSALVKALTGIDPDRLKEEKERGITIDLGFADLEFPEVTVGIIDVPGHERLVRNMLAGAGGMDMVMLVIAADEGIMPQTREHLSICSLLGIQAGLVAVTKTDLVDEELFELAVEEVKDFVTGTFLEKAPILGVSARTGHQVDLLKKTIEELALLAVQKSSGGLFRLPVDRVFTLKGFGTVATGTVLSGTVGIEDTLEILPCGLKAKVRGLHSHGRAIKAGFAGQRLAVNLQGIEKEDLQRGDMVVRSATFTPTRRMDVLLDLLPTAPEIKNRGLVHFHLATAELTARTIFYDTDKPAPGKRAYCQLRLAAPVVAVSGDRFIVRRLSPLETIGGGIVCDPSPPRRRKKEDAPICETLCFSSTRDKLTGKIKRMDLAGLEATGVYSWMNEDVKTVDEALALLLQKGEILRAGDLYLHKEAVSSLHQRVRKILEHFHQANPIKPGMAKEELKAGFKGLEPKTFLKILSSMADVAIEKDLVRLAGFTTILSTVDEEANKRILHELDKAGCQPPLRAELAASLRLTEKKTADLLKHLATEGLVVRINDSLYLTKAAYQRLIEALRDFSRENKEITVAQFRDLIGTTRKYALPYLEYLDGNKITLRTGDTRKILL